MPVHGDRIRTARKIRRLKQSELAEALGLTNAALSQIESQQFQPIEFVLDSIAAETGFPQSFFGRPPGPDIPEGSLAFRGRRSAMRRLPLERKTGTRRCRRARVPEDARDDLAGSRDPSRRLILSYLSPFPRSALIRIRDSSCRRRFADPCRREAARGCR